MKFREVLNVIIENIFSFLLQSMRLFQPKYKILKCSHAITFNKYTLGLHAVTFSWASQNFLKTYEA